MRKGILTFGLLVLGGWWLWKKSAKVARTAGAVLPGNAAGDVFNKNVSTKTGLITTTLPPVFQGRLTGPIEDKAIKSIPVVDV